MTTYEGYTESQFKLSFGIALNDYKIVPYPPDVKVSHTFSGNKIPIDTFKCYSIR